MPPDLKQVATLFNDCIASIREEKHDNLEQLAVDWLKGARYNMMRRIEAEYYNLARTRGNASIQPAWALNPSNSLYVSTESHPPILDPYKEVFRANLGQLLRDCGFNSTMAHGYGIGTSYFATIYFPHRLGNSAASAKRPRTLRITDQFSGTKGAELFGRLLTGADVAPTRPQSRGESRGAGRSVTRRATRSSSTRASTRTLRSSTRSTTVATLDEEASVKEESVDEEASAESPLRRSKRLRRDSP